MSHVPSLQAGNRAEEQEPPASHLVSQLEASREMVPIKSLFQGARPAWEHLQAVKALASGVFCGSLGPDKFLSYKPDSSCLHRGHWPMGHVWVQIQLFENYTDCSIFGVVIIGLVDSLCKSHF